ncbi:MAG: hypothetical protein AABZ15_10510 [Nitrospirota bacterium]
MIRPVSSIKITTLMILFACTGCAQVAYDSLRQNQSMNCQQMQGTADRDDCMRRSDMSYDEYQRQMNKQKQER